jgi:hypothetical protein
MEIPKPFCSNPNNIKAFVLGCDPTAKDKSSIRKDFQFVFDIGNDNRYFAAILANLNLLGISLEEIYVQNLVTDYQKEETAKNKEWQKKAEKEIPFRRQEFDSFDPSFTIPVFITSAHLYKALINPSEKVYTAKELYTNENLTPIKAEQNKLKRPLIPLFRHFAYNLSKHDEYKNRIHLFVK